MSKDKLKSNFDFSGLNKAFDTIQSPKHYQNPIT